MQCTIFSQIYKASLGKVLGGMQVHPLSSTWSVEFFWYKHIQKVELHCSCRLPEKVGVDQMAECDGCKVWYHQHCMDIASEVFDNPDVPWKCK